jgi:hypothetical protein
MFLEGTLARPEVVAVAPAEQMQQQLVEDSFSMLDTVDLNNPQVVMLKRGLIHPCEEQEHDVEELFLCVVQRRPMWVVSTLHILEPATGV